MKVTYQIGLLILLASCSGRTAQCWAESTQIYDPQRSMSDVVMLARNEAKRQGIDLERFRTRSACFVFELSEWQVNFIGDGKEFGDHFTVVVHDQIDDMWIIGGR